MRKAVLPLIIALSVSASAAETITTTTGKKYENVTISRVEPDGLVVETDAGLEKLPFTELPADLQKRFKYDPKAAAEFAEKNKNQQAELQRMAAEGANRELARTKATEIARAVDADRLSKAITAGRQFTTGAAQPERKRYSLRGKVLQSFSDGVLVECLKEQGVSGYKALEGTVLVRDAVAQEDGYVKATVEEDGFYDYVTTLGAAKRVPAVRIQK